MIVSRFLKTRHDFLNLLSTSKKVETMSENFHYNPVPVTNKNLFPHIETQHLYTKNDKRIPNLYKYVIWFEVSYYQSLKEPENVSMKNIVFTRGDFDRYYELHKNTMPDPFIVPFNITKIGNEAFQSLNLKQIVLPTTITSLGNSSFNGCLNLRYINIPNSVKLIGSACFYGCENLDNITISPNTKLGLRCFAFCKLLRNKIDVPKKLFLYALLLQDKQYVTLSQKLSKIIIQYIQNETNQTLDQVVMLLGYLIDYEILQTNEDFLGQLIPVIVKYLKNKEDNQPKYLTLHSLQHLVTFRHLKKILLQVDGMNDLHIYFDGGHDIKLVEMAKRLIETLSN
ncbi:hypothetical protein QTN25_007258 [Entamoeba marina]